MCFVPQGRACLLSLISPDGSAPAALVILLFDPPEPQNIGKHSASRLFYLFAPLDLLSSSFLFSDLLSSDSPFSESSHLCCCICPFCRKLHFLTSFEKYIKKYIKILYIYTHWRICFLNIRSGLVKKRCYWVILQFHGGAGFCSPSAAFRLPTFAFWNDKESLSNLMRTKCTKTERAESSACMCVTWAIRQNDPA